MPRVKDLIRVAGCMIRQPNFRAPTIDMNGKTVVLTGPTEGGIGFETAKTLSSWGAKVILAGRNRDSTKAASEHIKSEVPNAALDTVDCDLSSLSSVDNCGKMVKSKLPERPDVLICNAGAIYEERQEREDGIDMTFAVCALGHHKLIYLLQPRRVVWVSGDIYVMAQGLADPSYKGFGTEAYTRACLARILLTRELKRWNQQNGVEMEVACLHPGVINSQFSKLGAVMKWLAKALLIDTVQGAQPSILLASMDGKEMKQHWDLPYYHSKHGWVELEEDDAAMKADVARHLFAECDRISGIER